MKRILLTGMSGTGKSTLIQAIAARGYPAVDLDCADFSEWVDLTGGEAAPGTPVEQASAQHMGRDWVWREDRVQALLAAEHGEPLFVSGCASNMGKFLPQFDQVILLSAPAGVIVDRLATRTTNAYGKRADEVTRVLALIETVEPLLRRAASAEIQTDAPLEDVVNAVLRVAQG